MSSNQDPGLPIWVQIIILLGAAIINGYFVMAEAALTSVNRDKLRILEEDGDIKAKRILEFIQEPMEVISAVKVLTTFIGFLASAFAAVGVSNYFAEYLTGVGISYSKEISIVVITMVLAFFFIVIGKLYPENLAKQHSLAISRIVIGPVKFFVKILRPFTWMSFAITSLFLILTRQQVGYDEDEFSEEQVMSMLDSGQESGALKEEGKKMIDSIFAFDDKLAYEIMTPRTDVFSINIQDNSDVYIDELMELRHSRIPVYDDDHDNIVGILHIKDYLIKAREDGFDNVDLNKILRPPFFVPETKNIDALFFELQKTKQHIAILIDEYGGFSGIITMEDLIEEIVGEIDDEYDYEEDAIEKIKENSYYINGNVNLNCINEELGLDLESENVETLGGFIIDKIGEIPEPELGKNTHLEMGRYVMEVESVKDRRVDKVKLTILPAEQEASKEQ